jgi:hypothetical protein
MKVLTNRRGGSVVLVLAVVLAASCASPAVVAPNAPRRPARPENCPVQLFPTTRPTYPAVDLQSVEVVCNRALGRAACIEKLRIKSCAVGGDTLYGFAEGINPDGAGMFISASVAVRSEASPASSNAGTPAPVDDAAGAGCTPICSPGFACKAGQCIPECNPACEPAESCNRHRTCEPAAPAPGSAK